MVSAVHVSGLPGFFNGQVGFVSIVGFLFEVGLCIFGVFSSHDFCQLKRAMTRAIMLSIWRWSLFQDRSLAFRDAPQHSLHLTGGSLRVLEHFSWLSVDSAKIGSSPPAHQQVTLTVGRRGENTNSSLEGKVEWLQHHAHHAPRT
jgi:hypothetical protein